MGLIEDCEKYFGCSNLYDVVGIPKDSSNVELKRAYKKVSLLCHPDRVPDGKKEDATRKFQTLSKVHCILSDQEKRTVYDETGCIDEENSIEDKDWKDYWRLLFPKITVKDIEDFMKKYKGSSEEIEDLKKYYILYEGDMDKISETCMGYDVDEEENYRSILRDLIEKNEVPDFPNFTKESKAKRNRRIKKFKKEAAEVEKEKAMTEESLVNAIMKRSEKRESDFDDMIKNLEAKYGKSEKSKKRKGK